MIFCVDGVDMSADEAARAIGCKTGIYELTYTELNSYTLERDVTVSVERAPRLLREEDPK